MPTSANKYTRKKPEIKKQILYSKLGLRPVLRPVPNREEVLAAAYRYILSPEWGKP